MLFPLWIIISVPSTSRRGDSSDPFDYTTQWSGQSSWTFPPISILVKGYLLCLDANDTWPLGCQSLLITIWLKKSFFFLRALIMGNISPLWNTPKDPPSQKSFWGSTIINAFDIFFQNNITIHKNHTLIPQYYPFWRRPQIIFLKNLRKNEIYRFLRSNLSFIIQMVNKNNLKSK